MLESSAEYKVAIVGNKRRMYLKAIIDIIDPDLVYGSVLGEQAIFSQPEQLYDKSFETKPYITLERNRWLLNGKFITVPTSGDIPDMGAVGKALSDDNGYFSDPQYVELQFSNVAILQACSVYFSKNSWDGVPSDFKVEVKQGGTPYYSKEFKGNTSTFVALRDFTVNNPDSIRVTVTKWSKPGRRLRVSEILPGVYEEWDNDILASFSVTQQADTSCLTIPYGTCTLSMDNLDRRFEPRSKTGVFKSIEDRQGIDISIGVELPDGSVEYKPIGRYYQYSGGWKTSNNDIAMQWGLVDIIGLLSEREYILPESLPTTLEGWVKSIVSQLGVNFTELYTVDTSYSSKPVSVKSAEDVSGKTCGEILRYLCMTTGTWPRADAKTGKLAVEPYWYEGNKLTLDNMVSYPTMSANEDVAAIIFTLNDGNSTKYVVSGNSVSSNNTINVDNPFIQTKEEALQAAKLILSTYGGNQLDTTGRGDPSSELGDVDTVWLDKSSATTGRRIYQDFSISSGVLQNCKSTLLQADGSFMYEDRVVITQSGTYKAPDTAGELRLILVGRGSDGTAGTDGTWDSPGEDGIDGSGAKVWAETVMINPGQEFIVNLDGTDTLFGQYSSANGKIFRYGYTDIQSGDSFARTGVQNPLPGSGDGGAKGLGGVQGRKHYETIKVPKPPNWEWVEVDHEVIDNYPGNGTKGTAGASGCVVIYWNKEGI